MATITTLGFSIFSTYSGVGVSSARRDLENLNSDLDRNKAKLSSAASGFFSLSTAAAALGPGLIPVGAALVGVGVAAAAMAIASGAALGAYGFAMLGAIKHTEAMAKAHKALSPVQQQFITATREMKAAMEGVSTGTMNLTLHTATLITQGLTSTIMGMTPVIRAVAPVVDEVANAFRKWAAGDGLKRFVDIVIKDGVPALHNLFDAARSVLGFMGDGFRALAPTIVPVSKAIADGAAHLKAWGDAGGFERFLSNVQANAPSVKAFFEALWQAIVQITKALAGLGPISLSLTTILLKLIASLPIPVLQAIIVAIVAIRTAMLLYALSATAAAIATGIWSLAQTALIATMIAFDVAVAPAILIMGLIVLAVAAIGFAIFELVTHWTTVWNTIKFVAVTIWQGLEIAWRALVAAFVTVWQVVSAALIISWNFIWNGIGIVARAIWTGLQIAWNAFITGMILIWNAVSAALVLAWNVVWNTLGIVTRAIWTGLQVAWSALVNGLIIVWRVVSAALVIAWNAVWNGISIVTRAIWTGLQVAWGFFINSLIIVWHAVSAALVLAWNVVWNAMGIAARAIWTAMQIAWNAFINGLIVIWHAVSAALAISWNAVWNAMGVVARAIWTGLQIAWQALLNIMHAAWTGFTAIIGVAWNGFWNILRTVASAVWAAIQAAWQALLNIMHAAWSGFTAIIGVAWSSFWNTTKAVGMAIWAAIQAAWQVALNVMHAAWSGFTGIIGAAWAGFWNTTKAVGIAIWAAIQTAWQVALNVMHAAWSGFTGIIGAAWAGFWNTTKAVGIAIWAAIQTAWQVMLNVVHAAWSGFTGIIGAAWRGFWSALQGMFNAFAAGIMNATHALFNAMVAAWRAGANAIGAAWSVIKKLVRDPIQAVVNVVYNNGIVKLWNMVAGVFGAPKLGTFNLPGFASGGPIHGPGHGTSDSVVARLSTGEHVWTAQEVQAAGGHSAVMAMRSNVIGGNYQAAEHGDGFGGFALGGIIPSPGDILGAIGGFFKNAFKIVGGVASAAFNIASGFGGDIIGHLKDLALGGVADIVNSLIQKAANVGKDTVKAIIPGSPMTEQLIAGGGPGGANGASQQGALGGGANKGMIQTMVDFIKEWITSHDIPIGGGNTAEAQKWADAQIGKPYGLGTFGGSFDCSSFMSGIAQIILGKKPSPLFTTFAFTGAKNGPATFERNLNSPFMVGVENRGIGHMAGTLNGKNYEATPPRLRSGPGALGAHSNFFDMVYGMKAAILAVGGVIPSGQHLAIIDAALAAAGVPPPGSKGEWEAGMNTLIARESGWNSGAINRTDSNAAAGHPSQGLAQVIPSTFAAYHVAGTSTNILDPVANVAAAIRYIVARYGNITNVQQANANKPPMGYAMGTSSARRGWHLTGEDGPEWTWFGGGEKVLRHGRTPDSDGPPVVVTVENHWHGNPTKECVQHVEGEMADKLRMAVAAGVGKRDH